MARLTCHDSVSQWEHEQVSKYPEISFFIEKLKSNVTKDPGRGRSTTISINKKIVPCYTQSVNIKFFPREFVTGSNFITASYVYNDDIIYILQMIFA